MMIISEEFVIFFSVFICAYVAIKTLSGKKSSTSDAPNPPSLPCLPLIGSLPFLRQFSNISAFFMEKSYQLGPIFTFRVGTKQILVLNTEEVIREALVTNSRNFSSRPDVYVDKFTNPNNKGIVFMKTTPQWKRYHQMSLGIMREFGFGVKSIMEERILNEISAVVSFVKLKQGQPFDPSRLSIILTSNITTSILFGQRSDYNLEKSQLVDEVDRWLHNLNLIFDIAPFLRYIPPFKESLSTIIDCCKRIYALVETEIARSLDNRVNCFVSRFVEKEGPDFDREQLNFMIRDMITAGTDTTANTFQWMLIALANNPEIQRRLHSEIDSVISRDRFPTLQDQSKLPFLEATILEIYRWRTLVPMTFRVTTGNSVLKGYSIPAGIYVLVNLNAAHNNQLEWKNPDVFDPERFLDKDNNVIGRDRVIAFGLGRRSCFGEILARAEVFLIFASVVQRFMILPPEGQEKICDEPRVSLVATPQPFSIRLVERH